MLLEISQNSQENTCAEALPATCEYCEISKNKFFTEHLWTTASEQMKQCGSHFLLHNVNKLIMLKSKNYRIVYLNMKVNKNGIFSISSL